MKMVLYGFGTCILHMYSINFDSIDEANLYNLYNNFINDRPNDFTDVSIINI